MNTYIIDPMILYWATVGSVLQMVFAIVGGVNLIAAVGCIVGWVYNYTMMAVHGRDSCSYKQHEQYKKVCQRWTIITGIIGVIFVTASIFIPDKDTSYSMLIAKTVTQSNVEWTVQQVKEIVDYIAKTLGR